MIELFQSKNYNIFEILESLYLHAVAFELLFHAVIYHVTDTAGLADCVVLTEKSDLWKRLLCQGVVVTGEHTWVGVIHGR